MLCTFTQCKHNLATEYIFQILNSFSVTMAISYWGFYFLPFSTRVELAPVVSFTELGVAYLTHLLKYLTSLDNTLNPRIVLGLKFHVQFI